ncbi:MAG: hypothetical protein HC923_03020 [Myxococcales bacterium]|nr:hypothetical protein [Myxococcales bacterium]
MSSDSLFGNEVHVYAPATVANVAAGFDVLGFALHRPGDDVTVRFSAGDGLQIRAMTGAVEDIPSDANRNTAGIAAKALLRHLSVDEASRWRFTRASRPGAGSARARAARSLRS